MDQIKVQMKGFLRYLFVKVQGAQNYPKKSRKEHYVFIQKRIHFKSFNNTLEFPE